MAWMRRWPGAFPLFVDDADGGRVHRRRRPRLRRSLPRRHRRDERPRPARGGGGVAAQAGRGITTMLPSPDAAWVAGELARRFGLPHWQFALSATDANRFALRIARHATGRPKVAGVRLVLPRHRRRDARHARRRRPRRAAPRQHRRRRPIRRRRRKVVPFNDVDALAAALAPGDVACVARRAGAHEHRHRAAGAGIPRRAPRAHAVDTGRCC